VRVSRSGLIACVVYTVYFFGLFGWSFLTHIKTGNLLTSIAIFPAALFGRAWLLISARAAFRFPSTPYSTALLFTMSSLLLSLI